MLAWMEEQKNHLWFSLQEPWKVRTPSILFRTGWVAHLTDLPTIHLRHVNLTPTSLKLPQPVAHLLFLAKGSMGGVDCLQNADKNHLESPFTTLEMFLFSRGAYFKSTALEVRSVIFTRSKFSCSDRLLIFRKGRSNASCPPLAVTLHS